MAVGQVLSRYLCREFLIKLSLFSAVLFGVVYLFDTIELIRRSSGHSGLGIGSILALSLYKLPDVGQQILPFIFLFTTMATLWGLSQRKELESLRAAGLSVWQFMLPMLVTTFAFGLLYLTVLHPLSAAAMSRYNTLENMYFGNGQATISLVDDGLWIRQDDPDGYFIMNATTLDASHWTMSGLTLFFFDKNGHHTKRIDAPMAQLTDDGWHFKNASVYSKDGENEIVPDLRFNTTLTTKTIAESFSEPQTISFWRLPHFIQSLKNTGLDTTDITIYYQSLTALPLFLLSMVFLAAATSLRTSRHTKLLPIVSVGLGMGFGIFFFVGFLRALGAGHEIPILMATWTPPLIVILCASATLIAMEDG